MSDDDRLIAEYIALHGVTHVPEGEEGDNIPRARPGYWSKVQIAQAKKKAAERRAAKAATK